MLLCLLALFIHSRKQKATRDFLQKSINFQSIKSNSGKSECECSASERLLIIPHWSSQCLMLLLHKAADFQAMAQRDSSVASENDRFAAYQITHALCAKNLRMGLIQRKMKDIAPLITLLASVSMDGQFAVKHQRFGFKRMAVTFQHAVWFARHDDQLAKALRFKLVTKYLFLHKITLK